MSESTPTTALSLGPTTSFPLLAARYVEEYRQKIELAVRRLSEDQVWWRPHPSSNSVGNLLLHLSGNLSMWVLEGLGGIRYERHRSEEFSADRSVTRDDALERFSLTAAKCVGVIELLNEGALHEPVTVQTYEVNRLGVLFHAVEHLSYHTGQILMVCKQLTADSQPLEFYPRHDSE
ncbi:MAG: DUF1572 domain-containing protein [Thermoanaerobaculia bacterium]|nr:DUF1572 domain-containing protein [Thermoanaerobaculia bacterium]